jgi:tRNA threonylcarbamoyladenosine biosynthesis protein TsaE
MSPTAAVLTLPAAREADTARLAAALARRARTGDIIALRGDLGAGKTAFARFYIRALVGEEIDVPSPTFNLVLVYDCAVAPVWHFDLYRLENADEIHELGIDDAFADGISLIEWPDRAGGALPADVLTVDMRAADGDSRRRIEVSGPDSWAERLAAVRQELGLE